MSATRLAGGAALVLAASFAVSSAAGGGRAGEGGGPEAAAGGLDREAAGLNPVSAGVERAAAPDREALLLAWARAYYPGRSGDLMVVPREGDILTARLTPFMHGSPWTYDARIPLLLYGPGRIRPGAHDGAASHADLGATLSALLRLPPLAARSGRVLEEALEPGAPRPRILAVLILDAWRPDFLDRFADSVPVVRRLWEEGARFPEAAIDVLPTVTSVSHATLMTGAHPRFHGITGNGLYDPVADRYVGAFRGASPRNLGLPTLTDLWAAETRGRAVIAALGGVHYTGAALGGHGACAFGGRRPIVAYLEGGEWRSNEECYALPSYLRGPRLAATVENVAWPVDEASGGASRRWFTAHARFEGDAAIALLRGEPFGADTVTDLFLANIKASDRAGHAYGPASTQQEAAVAEMDRQVARILRALEERAGRDGYVVAITADHGMPDEPADPGRRHAYGDLIREVNTRFDPDGRGIVRHFSGDMQAYLDAARLAENGASAEDVAAFVESLPWIEAAFARAEVRRAAAALSRPGS